MFPDSFIQYVLDKESDMEQETCIICGNEIKTQIMKNTGVCGENCRKLRDGEKAESRAQTDAGITNLLNQPTGEVNLRGIK